MLGRVGGEAPPLPPGLRIEQVRDEEGLRAFEVAIIRGFEMRELDGLGPGAGFSTGMLTDDRHRLWVGWEADRPVCAAATFIEAGINDDTLGPTGPEARRRGDAATPPRPRR